MSSAAKRVARAARGVRAFAHRIAHKWHHHHHVVSPEMVEYVSDKVAKAVAIAAIAGHA